MHVEMSQATKGWQCYAAVSSSNWKLHFIYQGKVETFLALLYKLYFICVPGDVKCSFAKPYVNLFYGAYIKMYFIRYSSGRIICF